MSRFTANDHAHMARALELAARGRYTAHPNPMVGCVLVRDGEVVGEGWHEKTGEPHAEINALADAGDARGATVYLTLEPCAHHGRTAPCADALVEAGVAEVVFAIADPFDQVDGRGEQILVAAGIPVKKGLMQEQAEALNRGFLSRVRRGRPFVRLKIAASLDGATAMASGESQWITGPAARADVQRLRAEAGAILTGIGTVIADDPSLTVRDPGIDTLGRQPLRAIIDSTLRMPRSSIMLSLEGETVVYATDVSARGELEAQGATVVEVAGNARVDLPSVLTDLGDRDVNVLLVEAGPTLSGALLEAELVDELVIYQSPHIMGSETRRMVATPGWLQLADRQPLDIVDVRRVGNDMRITARPGTRN